ncbi:MAG: glycoside hydrolase [Crocinitomicaceae bacterium]
MKFFLCLLLLSLSLPGISQNINSKMNGISFVGTRKLISSSNLVPVEKINANWITVMPFAFIPKGTAKVQYNQNFQWSGETVSGIEHTIKLAKQKNLKILLKPHIWMHYSWIGDLTFDTEDEWMTFEETYTNYILEFAKLSEKLSIEVFCIGVEVKKIVIERPNFWFELIGKVREVYTGKITYAANWDNYQHVKFWSKLDYIGIDAYFPISDAKTPSYQACYIGWKTHYEAIKTLSKAANKKVIFTEFGYRNIDFTGKEPWTESSNQTFNSMAQENAYRAIFSRFWGENWFAGGFLWKWFPDHQNTGGLKNNRFTPQNKPVQKIIKHFYGSGIEP